MDEDQKIILSILNGHINHYTNLVKKYQNLVYTIAHSIVKEEETACDIVQDSFVKAYEYAKKRPIDNFKSFVCRLATNQSIDYTKHRATAQEKLECLSLITPSESSSAEDDYIKNEQNHLLQQKINSLDPHYRDVIFAYYFENQSYAQIAKEKNIPLKTVETRLYRAKKQLKNMMKEEII